jgi:hypothetical protein
MPRRHFDDDDDFDDDDRPGRRESETGGGGMAVWLFVSLGLGALVVVGVITVLVVSRKKDREADTVRNPPPPSLPLPTTQDTRPAPQPVDLQPAPKPEVPPPQPKPKELGPLPEFKPLALKGNVMRTKPPVVVPPRGQPGANWNKAIGTWRRDPIVVDLRGLPAELELRKDFTAQATHIRANDTVIHDMMVEVQIDQGDRLALALHVERGQYYYSFRVKPDGTMVLQFSGREDVVYVRVK